MARFKFNPKEWSLPRISLRPISLAFLTALFLLTVHNRTFFGRVVGVYDMTWEYARFYVCLVLLLGCVLAFPLVLFGTRHAIKPLVCTILLCSSFASYFMDELGIPIDVDMLRNATQTNLREALDLMTVKLGFYVLLGGLVPCLVVSRVSIVTQGGWSEARYRLKWTGFLLVFMVSLVLLSSSNFASFFREHKPIRYYANPTGYLISLIKLAQGDGLPEASREVKPVGLDAKQMARDRRRRLIVFVVGETARADRFSLNGYARETNPLLASKDVVSYANVSSLGTSTAASLPLMFSLHSVADPSPSEALSEGNLLDVLDLVGVHVLWCDNNSSSKGVALRVPYLDCSKLAQRSLSEEEPRDLEMLVQVEEFLSQSDRGDVFIVLHQMGSHGPAYYKRYPSEFAKFQPACETKELQRCSQQEIDNAYDNSILYTDYFLAQTIDFLESHSDEFETGMLYFSDHGESLGEKGMYLHGYPRFMAPKEQTWIPAILWFDRGLGVDMKLLQARQDDPISHAYIAHTVLGLFDVKTVEYRGELDLLSGCY